jgi:hypothetical protein
MRLDSKGVGRRSAVTRSKMSVAAEKCFIMKDNWALYALRNSSKSAKARGSPVSGPILFL